MDIAAKPAIIRGSVPTNAVLKRANSLDRIFQIYPDSIDYDSSSARKLLPRSKSTYFSASDPDMPHNPQDSLDAMESGLTQDADARKEAIKAHGFTLRRVNSARFGEREVEHLMLEIPPPRRDGPEKPLWQLVSEDVSRQVGSDKNAAAPGADHGVKVSAGLKSSHPGSSVARARIKNPTSKLKVIASFTALTGGAGAAVAAIMITLQINSAFAAALVQRDRLRRLNTINHGGLGVGPNNGGLLISEGAA